MTEPEDFSIDRIEREMEAVGDLMDTLNSMGQLAFHFEGNAFVVTSEDEDVDTAIRFISVRENPEVSIKGDKILATASRLQVVEDGTTRELPVVDTIDITLSGLDTDELHERLGSE